MYDQIMQSHNAKSAMPQQQTAVASLVGELAGKAADLSAIDQMLSGMHTRVYGPSPEGGQDRDDGRVREVRSGILGEAKDRLGDLELLIGRIRAKVEQLSTAI